MVLGSCTITLAIVLKQLSRGRAEFAVIHGINDVLEEGSVNGFVADV